MCCINEYCCGPCIWGSILEAGGHGSCIVCCLALECFTPCTICYAGMEVAKKYGIEESPVMAILKGCCCTCCYAFQIQHEIMVRAGQPQRRPSRLDLAPPLVRTRGKMRGAAGQGEPALRLHECGEGRRRARGGAGDGALSSARHEGGEVRRIAGSAAPSCLEDADLSGARGGTQLQESLAATVAGLKAGRCWRALVLSTLGARPRIALRSCEQCRLGG